MGSHVLLAGETAERLAVVRDAFAESTDIHRPLSSLVAALGNDSLAVAAEASEYHRRLVVDEYRRGGDGQYVLQNVSTDFYRSSPPPTPPSPFIQSQSPCAPFLALRQIYTISWNCSPCPSCKEAAM